MAETGDNSAASKATLFKHFNRLQNLKTILDEARAEYKTARKEAKAEGVVLADIDFMFRCVEIDDPSIVSAELKRQMQIAAWLVLPVNYQPDFFEDRAPTDERAFKEGEKAAMTNGDCKPPYDENSKPGQEWIKGWHSGQAQMRAEMQANMEAKLAASKADDGAIPEMADEAA